MSQLKTGDILCIRDPQFLHAGACLSQNILCWEVNHAAIVIDPSDLDDQAALFKRQGITEKGKLHVLHVLQTGMKVWELSRYLGSTNKGGCMYVRQVVVEGFEETKFRKRVAKTIDDFFEEIADKCYEENYSSLITAYFDSCEGMSSMCNSKGDDSSLFCSELVAIALHKAEILTKNRPADEFVPSDFLESDGKFIEMSPMCENVSLGPCRVLKS